MSTFTKKPVTIQAVLWTGKNLREVIKFTDGRDPETKHDFAAMKWDEYEELVERDGLKIFTLEGKMNADVGDWIIRGVKGEFYPCKPDIFAMTYEAEQPAPTAVPAAVSEGERRQFEAWCSAERYRFVTLNRLSDGRYAHPGIEADWEVWQARAALKAQPAPTEAAQYPNTPEIDALMEKWSDDGATRGAAFIELRDKARQIERAFYAAVEQARTMAYAAQGNPSNNSSSSAQGEDSARLDAERYRYFRRIYGAEARLIRGPIYAAETPEQFDAGIDECIRYEQEVARASAETGGVKP